MIKNLNTNGLMNAQDALVAIMVAGGASDENISNRELISISRIVDHLPIFKSYDPSKIKIIAETVFDLFEEEDGLDALFGLVKEAERAIERARAGEGPTLLECLTYRYRGHSLADPDELRSEKEKEFWGKRDPIKKLAKEIIDEKLATEEELKDIEKRIDKEISESVKNALEAPEPPSDELTKYIWAED